MNLSIIISTYNSPALLEKVILGYASQTVRDFELVVAEDGTDEKTAALVEKMKTACPFPILHIRQEHTGFGKCAILNKAIEASHGDYLLISDGDCIPRCDFVAVHLALRKPGHFISGGYCKLPAETSERVSPDDIRSQNAFLPAWLRVHGMKKVPLKLSARGLFARLLNRLTPTRPSWNGHNSSGWKSDILAVNGFNEDMKYGGLDRELGERLINNGIIPIQARHLAVCIHLYHSRGYVNDADLRANAAIREENRRRQITWARNGIRKGERPS